MLEIVAGILLISGAVVVLIGAIGLIRFPDFFSRLHAAGIVDTLGVGLILLALLLLSNSVYVLFKVLLIGILIFLLSPLSSHGLSRAALDWGLKARLVSNQKNQQG